MKVGIKMKDIDYLFEYIESDGVIYHVKENGDKISMGITSSFVKNHKNTSLSKAEIEKIAIEMLEIDINKI